MKRKFVFSAVLLSGLLALSSFTSKSEDEPLISLPAGEVFKINDIEEPSKPFDRTIYICPGNGVPCRVTITSGGKKTVYNGSKDANGPDAIIKN